MAGWFAAIKGMFKGISAVEGGAAVGSTVGSAAPAATGATVGSGATGAGLGVAEAGPTIANAASLQGTAGSAPSAAAAPNAGAPPAPSGAPADPGLGLDTPPIGGGSGPGAPTETGMRDRSFLGNLVEGLDKTGKDIATSKVPMEEVTKGSKQIHEGRQVTTQKTARDIEAWGERNSPGLQAQDQAPSPGPQEPAPGKPWYEQAFDAYKYYNQYGPNRRRDIQT